MSDFQAATSFWDREVAQLSHVPWMADPEVRAYINTAVTGSPYLWPLSFLESVTKGRQFERALSIGCGSGALERDLLARGICKSADALDGSLHSLKLAMNGARDAGYADRVRYFAADFNRPVLPRNTYDLVLFQQSMHHVGKLEKLLREVLLSLEPDGVLYIDEYVGPSRHEWLPSHIARQRAAYQMLPRELRMLDELPLPIQVDDPSEGIRSGEIMEQLAVGFEVVAERDYGGNYLSIVFPQLDWAIADASLVTQLIESEKAMLRSGESSWCKVAVLRPKRGAAKQLAQLNYFLTPKVKRVAFEVRQRL
jgi:SAM-dependent methyltransferase